MSPCCAAASRAASQRIHVEPLADVLDEVGGLLPVRELPVRLDPAAARRRVLQLLPGEQPFGGGPPVHRHDASAAEPRRWLAPGGERADSGAGTARSRAGLRAAPGLREERHLAAGGRNYTFYI